MTAPRTSAWRLPDFLVVGGRKCGTTWLDALLRQHPGLRLPTTTKEVSFFDEHWERGLDWYARQFGTPESTCVLGDVTPGYLHSKLAVDRAAEIVPSARIVVVLRDPVDRAWSDYRHALRKGDVEGSLGDAVRTLPSILDESRYSSALSRWIGRFGEGVLVLYFDDLVSEPARTLERLVSHVGAPPFSRWELSMTRNEAMSARSKMISRLAHQLSRRLHRSDLHFLAQGAKRLGIGRLLERPDLTAIGPDERALLLEALRADLHSLRSLVPADRRPTWLIRG